MALPETYSELTLASYLYGTLGQVATLYGWPEPTEGDMGKFAEIVNDALDLYGVTTIDDADDPGKLRSAARVALWQRVLDESMGYFNFWTDNQRFDVGKMRDYAMKRLEVAQMDASRHGVVAIASPPAEIKRLNYVNDPYVPKEILP